MHGMPLAFLLGLVDNANQLPGFGWFKPCLHPKEIVYIGLRDLDRGEKTFIKKLGIKAFTVSTHQILFVVFLITQHFFHFRCMILTEWVLARLWRKH
jgi:arginase family enzyme